ncbi:MAG: alpha/beta hydrolase [Pseudomonadota bacterium]
MLRYIGLTALGWTLAACASAPQPDSPPPPPEPVIVETTTAERPRAELFMTQGSAMEQCESVSAVHQVFTCMEIFYGTNRELLEPGVQNGERPRDLGNLFGPRADRPNNCDPNADLLRDTATKFDTCHLGTVTVSVPFKRDDKLEDGGGSPKFARSGEELSDRDLRSEFAIMGFDRLAEADFIELIQLRLGGATQTEGHAIVYVHGFNVPFRNAAFRAAQLKYDTGFDGPVMFFSWPANQSAFAYLNDQTDADLSVDALARFLRLAHHTVTEQNPDAEVHIIAHSMGTRVTAQALSRIASFEDDNLFGEVIFAAGDLDDSLFTEWIGSATHLMDGVTLYASNMDGAVAVSSVLRNLTAPFGTQDDPKRRIGFFDGDGAPATYPAIVDEARPEFRVDTIDISRIGGRSLFGFINLSRWFVANHAAYANSTNVTDDMIALICQSNPEDGIRPMPPERGMLEFETEDGFWRALNTARGDRPIKPGCTAFGTADG